MQLALVAGTATATVKHPSLAGWKLLLVQPLAADGRTPDGEPVLALDNLGAGPQERVLVTNDGRYARELVGSETSPARWSVIGLQDRGAGRQ
jgi:ethanolamine utilization protein EutN